MHTTEKDIYKAQKWLQGLGSSVKVNGKWSIGMKTAVYSFQRKYNIPVTGELDKITWKTLKRQNSLWKRFIRSLCGHGGGVKHHG